MCIRKDDVETALKLEGRRKKSCKNIENFQIGEYLRIHPLQYGIKPV